MDRRKFLTRSAAGAAGAVALAVARRRRRARAATVRAWPSRYRRNPTRMGPAGA